ncbi:hypothetical protein SAMN05216436_102123 [bacterium A37T11]|nr:hypothetical protein SAMN05216436_102123 [bacterium A37T11]
MKRHATYAGAYSFRRATHEEIEWVMNCLGITGWADAALVQQLQQGLLVQELPAYCLLLAEGDIPMRVYFFLSGAFLILSPPNSAGEQRTRWMEKASGLILTLNVFAQQPSPETLMTSDNSLVISMTTLLFFHLLEYPAISMAIHQWREAQLVQREQERDDLHLQPAFDKMLYLIRKLPDAFFQSNHLTGGYLDLGHDTVGHLKGAVTKKAMKNK